MVLENELCRVEINTDPCYTVASADNGHYDVILNPCNYRKSDMSKTLSIHVSLPEREYRIALTGSFFSDDRNCAVLDGETLTVLQDKALTQIAIAEGTVLRHTQVDCYGCNFEIHRVENGYIVYGEVEITMLDLELIKKWSFSGRDIFVSVTGKQAFEIRNDTICLYDFEDNYYEIDFSGKLLR